MVHTAKARRGLDMRWTAKCSCSWAGPIRDTQTAADGDAATHVAAELKRNTRSETNGS